MAIILQNLKPDSVVLIPPRPGNVCWCKVTTGFTRTTQPLPSIIPTVGVEIHESPRLRSSFNDQPVLSNIMFFLLKKRHLEHLSFALVFARKKAQCNHIRVCAPHTFLISGANLTDI